MRSKVKEKARESVEVLVVLGKGMEEDADDACESLYEVVDMFFGRV